MRKLLKTLLFGCVFSVNADCQLNSQENYAHAPFDSNDTDNEIKIKPIPTSGVFQYEGDQQAPVAMTVAGFCTTAPDPLKDLVVGGEGIRVDNDTTGETCSLTDSDGNQRDAASWAVKIRRVSPPRDAVHKNFCYYDVVMWINNA